MMFSKKDELEAKREMELIDRWMKTVWPNSVQEELAKAKGIHDAQIEKGHQSPYGITWDDEEQEKNLKLRRQIQWMIYEEFMRQKKWFVDNNL